MQTISPTREGDTLFDVRAQRETTMRDAGWPRGHYALNASAGYWVGPFAERAALNRHLGAEGWSSVDALVTLHHDGHAVLERVVFTCGECDTLVAGTPNLTGTCFTCGATLTAPPSHFDRP